MRAGLIAGLAASCLAFVATLAPAAASAAVAPPKLTVSGASLIETSTGQQLYGVNPEAQRPIASTTKLMTALVVLQHVHQLGEVFKQNDFVPAAADSQIGLLPGERMSVHDLLLAMLLPSADDAAEDLAYNVGGGSIARFVAMMNQQVRVLHLLHTHYTTPIGLDTAGNYSSPSDLVRLAAYVMAHSPFFRRAVALPRAVLYTGRYRRSVVNRDDLVGRIPWINGIKTGHTAQAGYVLVSSGTRNGMTLIGSVLGTVSPAARDANALALLDYGFAEFHLVSPVRDGAVMARLPVEDSPGHRAVLLAAGSFTRVVARTDLLSVKLRVPARLSGPLPRHAVVGQAVVRIDGRPVARIPLILARAVPAVSPITQAARFLTRTTTLMWLALLIGAAVLATGARRRRRPRVVAGGQVEE